MIHLLCETDADVHAVGRAHMWGDLFPGAPWQVVRVRPGVVPSRSAYPGGNPNPACSWCSGYSPGPGGSRVEKAAWEVAITRGMNISRGDIRALLAVAGSASDEDPAVRCGCLVPCAARNCGAKGGP